MAQLEISELYTLTHHYRLPRKMGGGKVYVVNGVYLIVSKTKMVRALGHDEFGEEELEIPRGRGNKFELLSDAELKHYVEPEENDESVIYGALEFQEWLDYMEDKELTIADIEAMKPGEQLRVIQLHRNLGDMVLESRLNPYGQSIPAVKFFEPVGGLYTHNHHLSGYLLDIPDDAEMGDHEFNFHLNYRGKNWYPLGSDGLLPVATGESCIRGAVADYRKYPKTTKVGMRGPMLRLSDVEKAPPVYHYEQKFFW